MTRPQAVLTIALTIAAGVGGYAATLATRPAAAPAPAADPATEALLDWLNASPEQRVALGGQDTNFAADLQKLRGDLAARRAELAATLQDTAAAESAVMQCVDAVAAASAALDRRVARYLLSVREHLTPEQQRRLFGLCAETVREGRGRQWRGGRGAAVQTSGPRQIQRHGRGDEAGHGRGSGGRGGPGRGRGPQGEHGGPVDVDGALQIPSSHPVPTHRP